jgi:hypothetical protein
MDTFWQQARATFEYLLVALAYGLCVGVALGKL